MDGASGIGTGIAVIASLGLRSSLLRRREKRTLFLERDRQEGREREREGGMSWQKESGRWNTAQPTGVG